MPGKHNMFMRRKSIKGVGQTFQPSRGTVAPTGVDFTETQKLIIIFSTNIPVKNMCLWVGDFKFLYFTNQFLLKP